MTDPSPAPLLRLRAMAKSALRPVATPLLARVYARVDARTEETVWRVLGNGAGLGSAVTDEHVRLLLDAMSQQNAALHDLRRKVSALEVARDDSGSRAEQRRTDPA